MIRLPLRLTRLPHAMHAPAAWFIGGSDPALWLEELARWNVPLAKAKLFVLATSVSNRDATGVLVLLDCAKPREMLRAESYGCVAGRVYLPVNAQFDPPVTDAELSDLAAFEISVVHPGAGLTGFRSADAISVADLLQLPERRADLWDRAKPGASPYPRLISVEPDVIISLDELMEAGRGNIGSKSPETLPPHSKETNPLAGRVMIAGLGAAGAIAGALGGLAAGIGSLIPGGLGGFGGAGASGSAGSSGGGAGGGLFDAFKEWAAAHVQRLSEQLENARNKELDRLSRMLDEDPDNGLSYAIPLAGKEGQPRGASPPGASLVRRGTNFSLNNLRGGQAVDPWGMSEKMRMELRQKYLKAANRELALGRFRRAAYIFSELLGDHNAAANALKQGRHFREAAVIYRDLIKNKALAAECLEEGGLITEAIALREELKQWLEVARLYTRIERPDEARAAYRKAVDEALARMDRVSAARILSDSMGEHDEALAALSAGWPDTPQAEQCLTAQFALLGKLGRHGAALKVVQGLRAHKLPDWQTQTAVEICSRQSLVYPDAAFRAKSADTTRVLAGQLMAKATDRVRALTTAVANLAPEDRLLSRDAGRYIEHRLKKERQTAPKPHKPALKVSNKPVTRKLVRTISLKEISNEWSSAVSYADGFLAIGGGSKDHILTKIVRGSWNGKTQVGKKFEVIGSGDELAICAPHNEHHDIVILNKKHRHIGGKWNEFVFERPDELTPDTVAFRYDERDVTYILRVDGAFDAIDCNLEVFGRGNKLFASHDIPHFVGSKDEPVFPVPMAVRNDHAYISDGASGLITFHAGKSEVTQLHRTIRSIVASAPFTRTRIAIAMEEGGVVLWPEGKGGKQNRINFGQGMFAPVIGFTRGGDLIAATKTEVRVYHTEGETLVISCSVAGPGEEPYAVLPAEGVDEYALFLKNGDVQIWHV